MANAVVTVLEADGVTQTDVTVLDVGRQAAAASKSTAMSTEDKAVFDSLATKLDTAITALQIIDNMVLAAGTAVVGKVGLNDGTNAITFTDAAVSASAFAIPVIQHPDGQNANGQTTKANSTPTVLASDDNAVVALELIDDAIKADDAAFTPGTTKVMMAGFQADEASTDSVDEGDAGAARMTLDRKVITTLQPHTNGGLSVFRSLDLDETEEDVKTSAGCLYKIRATNRTTSVRYLKLYNATAANVTVGTTTPIDTIPLPSNASDYTVLTESFGGLGLTFDTALSMAVTTGFADNDAGAPGANDVIVSAYYK
jgi:hypothetical protein